MLETIGLINVILKHATSTNSQMNLKEKFQNYKTLFSHSRILVWYSYNMEIEIQFQKKELLLKAAKCLFWRCHMTIGEIVINLILGVISGGVSGWVVTWFFKKRDSSEQWERSLREDKQNMSSYISLVLWELEYLINSNDFNQTKELERLLVTSPQFASFGKIDKIHKKHRNYTKNAYQLFQEIYNYIKYEVPKEEHEIPKLKYHQFRSKLLRCQLDILMINKDKKSIKTPEVKMEGSE